MRQIILIALLLVLAVTVSATAPNAWDTTAKDAFGQNGIYIPPCTNGSVKHWEVPTSYADNRAVNIQIFDSLKSLGYTNLRFFYADGQTWIWSADCTLGA